MLMLNLFPLPRRYERVPGALAVALAVALVIVYFNERTPLAAGLLAGGLAVLVLVYVIRARQKKEWSDFFREENRRLLEIKGAQGPARYIPGQQAALSRLRHPELKLTAQLNLGTALLANGDSEGALALLGQMPPPEKMPNPTLRLVYWTQLLECFTQKGDVPPAQAAYEAALATLPEVSDLLKISFMPSEIRYRLLLGEYETALKQLGELPLQDLDEAGRQLLEGCRAVALRGMGIHARADKLVAKLEGCDLLPSTRNLLRRAAPEAP